MSHLPSIANSPAIVGSLFHGDIPELNMSGLNISTENISTNTQHVSSHAIPQTPFDAHRAQVENSPPLSSSILGRSPWYSKHGNKTPFVIGIAGGSASGKTFLSQEISKKIAIPWIVTVSCDLFYKSLTPEEQIIAKQGNYNFDHPNSMDMDKIVETIKEMKSGRCVDLPIYDFATHSRLKATDRIYGADIIIIEGILLFYDERIRELLDLKLYVDTDADLRLARRILRDIHERGRDVASILDQYQKTVKSSFEQYILPTKRYADIIIPWNEVNNVAVDLICQHIVSRLEKRSAEHSRLVQNTATILKELPSNITILPKTNHLIALHTLIRNKDADYDTFTFTVGRIARLVVTAVVDLLDFKMCNVSTPTGSDFAGLDLISNVSAVCIARTGNIFDPALRAILPNISIGKIVVQQDSTNKKLGPRLYYAKLPTNINDPETNVVLFDGVLATGGVVAMAIHVLLDHGVPEDKIVFCCLIASPEGLASLLQEFPKIRIISSYIEDGLDDNSYCVPGLGYLGERYFGTSSDDV